MVFAQKLHSEEEMEADRIEFYERFKKIEVDEEKDQPHMTYKLSYE